MKAHILFTFRDGPWGGCNQFLTGLRDVWRAAGCWAETPDAADVVLFDSYNNAREVIAAKRRLPGIPFVHRLDGPISAYRGQDLALDRLIHALNAALADGTVFQSEYSRAGNLGLGMQPPPLHRVVGNAPRGECFFATERAETRPDGGRKVRILAASFSPNWNKGFDVYAHLDQHLDFGRFEMTFVGNSPVAFKHVTHLPPQDSKTLGETMRSHDIYLTASRQDPCSNALIEALSCGLPAVALRSGGHPEIVGRGGELFDGTADVLAAIDKVAGDIAGYRQAIRLQGMEAAGEAYLAFLREVVERTRQAKRPGLLKALALDARVRLGQFTRTASWLVRTRLLGRSS